MNSLMSFVFLVALLASGYFLIRLIIATVRKQPTDSFKKKLIASVLAAVVALVGFNVTRSPEQIAAHKEKVEAEHKAAEEKKLADEKAAEEKRLANEKAAEEKRIADEKAAEEKRIADEKAAEQKRIADEKAAEQKAQEEARKKAEREAAEERRRQEQALAKTLRVTPEKFNERFLNNLNAIAQKMGIEGADYMDEPRITDNGDTETHVYMFDTALGMNEVVDKNTGMIKEVNVATFNVTEDSVMVTLLAYAAAIKSISPELSQNEFNTINRELGLDANIFDNLIKDKSTVYKGKRYNHRLIQDGVAFSVSIP